MARINPTSTTIRKGFEKINYWSMAETSQVTGLAVSTLYKHAKEGRFIIISTPSPFKAYAPSVKDCYQNGKPNNTEIEKDLFSAIER